MNWEADSFQLNGHSFASEKELIGYASNVSKSLCDFLTEWFNEQAFVLVKTSGSTGKPKEIFLRKDYMKNSAIATGEFFKVQKETRALCCLPIEYIAGKMMVVRGLILGWHLDVVEPSSNPLEKLDQYYNFSAMVPLQLQNSLDKIHRIEQLIVGGGVVSHKLQEAIQQVPTKIFATYGMTETITHIAVKPLNLASNGAESPHYKLLPNISVSTDRRGCLVIQAPKVSDEVIVTNDMVEIVSEKEFVWKGRFDNVINSGGIKLHPEDIERKLSSYITSRFFVAGIPDEQLGEKLVLLMEGKKDAILLNKVETLHQILAKFEVPKEVHFISQFIETPTGKIQRKKTLEKIVK